MQSYWLELALSLGSIVVIGYLFCKFFFTEESCENCDGTGISNHGCCPYCGGTGKKYNKND